MSSGSDGGPVSRAPRSSQDLTSRLGLAPPSEPRPPSRPSVDLEVHPHDAHDGRAGRLPLVVALGLVLVVIAIPLYLWRRPRVESAAAATALTIPPPEPAAPAPAAPPAVAPSVPPGIGGARAEPVLSAHGVQVGEPRVLGCSDGAKKTAAEACDRLPTLERAFARAVEESSACVGHDGPGSIQFSFDVSFRKKGIAVTSPREARSVKSRKAVAACVAQVKSRIEGRLLEGVPHGHERYRIAVTAAFPAGLASPRPRG